MPVSSPEEVSVSPSALVFEDTVIGGTAYARIEVRNPGAEVAEVTVVRIGAPFSATTGEIVVPAAGVAEMLIAYRPTASGPHRGTLVLDVCGGGGCERRVDLRGGTRAEPVQLECFVEPITSVVGGCDIGFVSCWNSSLGVIQISSLDLEPASPELLVFPPPNTSIPPGGGVSIDLQFCPSAPGVYRAVLDIGFGDAGQILSVPIFAEGIDAGTCQFDVQPTLDFGVVPVGQRVEREIQLFNTGAAQCNLRASILDATPNGAFSTDAGQIFLPPGGVAFSVVAFETPAVGGARGLLSIVSESNGVERTVELSAEVAEAAAPLVVSTGPHAGLIPLQGGSAPNWINGSDDGFVEIPLSFPFVLFGREVPSVWLTTNGVLAFSQQPFNYANDVFPRLGPPNHMIAWWWDDLHPGMTSGRGVHYQFRTDAAGRGVLDIEFDRIPHYSDSPGAVITAQIRLREDGNVVEVLYGEVEGSSNGVGFSASAGWEGPFGLTGAATLPGCTPTCRSFDWPTNTVYTFRDPP